MITVRVDESWTKTFPGARLGLVEAEGLPPGLGALEAERIALEEELRTRHGAQDRRALRDLPAMRAFEAHFKPHGRTYHVLQQLESVACKGRPIPSRLGAVTALFMAELRHGLVAAGHDLDRLRGPLVLEATRGGERYTNLGGAECVAPAGDMMLRDGRGILSTVLQGPERESPIGPGTRRALFTIYAPAGLPLEAQVADLERYLSLLSSGVDLRSAILPAE